VSVGTESTRQIGRRIGYVVAIGINFALLVIANNLVEWGWLPWLTADLDQVLPVINVSIVATIVANAVYFAYDPPWLKAVSEFGLGTISLIVAIRSIQVFPFDFSAYDFAWDTLVRWMLGIAIFGIAIGMLTQLTKLARLADGSADGTGP
jgi:hypothetical protein